MSDMTLPPLPVLFSEHAETALIAGLLIDSYALDNLADQLLPRHFFLPECALVYSVMLGLFHDNRPIDVVTVAEVLERRGELDDLGGLAWFSSLVRNSVGSANVKHYAEIIVEKAMMRGGISAASSLVERLEAGDWEHSPTEVLQSVAAQIESLADTDASDADTLTATQVAHSAVLEIQAILEAGDKPRGVQTGLSELDAALGGGFRAGDLVILAGRPGMGKTVLAMNIAERLAERAPVAVFSMEMGREQLGMRQIASLGSVNLGGLMRAELTEDEQHCMVAALGKIDTLKLEIDFRPALTVAQVRAKCRKLHRKHGSLGLIVVDYLQLMQHPGTENRVNEITKISGGLKALAKEMQCPVIALSQLSRKVEERMDKHPQMADLRESGSIEQDADTILFAYRDEYYQPDSPYKGVAEIGIAKQRMGESGKWVRAVFEGHYSRFRNLAPGWSAPAQPKPAARKGGFA
ncbi:replicative DNA helicase [Chitinimonas arctica]|uniref:Replicative DNA helicase n=2 Tax=Chitinimonas arctica TaxID=2594795 RepID=A0A516SBW3_9NEIS|nr:replicative DNA helicase [Chitinimonas arctica]